MSNFESFLAQKLEEYVTYRKNLGYAKKALRPGLNAFDRYLKEQNAGWDDMQPSFFLQLRSNMQKHPNTVSYAPPPPWWIQCEKAWNSTEIKK